MLLILKAMQKIEVCGPICTSQKSLSIGVENGCGGGPPIGRETKAEGGGSQPSKHICVSTAKSGGRGERITQI